MAKKKYYGIRSKYGVGGVVLGKPVRVAQDKRAKPGHGYAAVFFPKIKQIGPACIWTRTLVETFSQTKAAAIVKYVDGVGRRKGESKAAVWEQYHRAGWRIRKVKITDMGES